MNSSTNRKVKESKTSILNHISGRTGEKENENRNLHRDHFKKLKRE